jgi:hypothetical protein
MTDELLQELTLRFTRATPDILTGQDIAGINLLLNEIHDLKKRIRRWED